MKKISLLFVLFAIIFCSYAEDTSEHNLLYPSLKAENDIWEYSLIYGEFCTFYIDIHTKHPMLSFYGITGIQGEAEKDLNYNSWTLDVTNQLGSNKETITSSQIQRLNARFRQDFLKKGLMIIQPDGDDFTIKSIITGETLYEYFSKNFID
jgi:hypothetical protein